MNKIPFNIQPISIFCASKIPINLFFSCHFPGTKAIQDGAPQL